MISLRLNKLLDDKGIADRVGFMKKAGFTYRAVWRLLSEQRQQIHFSEMEKMCLALKCTPNDLFEWSADPDTLADGQPLNNIKRKNENSLTAKLNEMPIEKINAVKEFIAGLE